MRIINLCPKSTMILTKYKSYIAKLVTDADFRGLSSQSSRFDFK